MISWINGNFIDPKDILRLILITFPIFFNTGAKCRKIILLKKKSLEFDLKL